jgi:hypothetical protein
MLLDPRLAPGKRIPIGALPSADILEIGVFREKCGRIQALTSEKGTS